MNRAFRLGVLLTTGLFCFITTHMFVDEWLAECNETKYKVVKLIYSPKHPHLPQCALDLAVGIEKNGRLIGAGVIVDSGEVLTAAHVVDDPHAQYHVRFGRDGETGSVLASQAVFVRANEDADLALLKCFTPMKVTPPIIAGDSIRMYTPLFTIGSPLGPVERVPSPIGYLAAKNHDFEYKPDFTWMCSIPATFGNSGGGVFDANTGALVGILVAGPQPGHAICSFVAPDVIRGFLNIGSTKISKSES